MKNSVTCPKCKDKINLPAVIKRKVMKQKREFMEQKVVYKTYSCKCGNSRFFGDREESEIDKKDVKIFTSFNQAIDHKKEVSNEEKGKEDS